MIRVQHIHGESFVLYDQAAGKQLAGPGSRQAMEEERREIAFRACPILRAYVGALLEDLQHSESDEACSEDREARDSGTIYTLPADEFAKCEASCERFMRENGEAIAAALELEPGSDGLRYTNGRSFDYDRIGYYFYMTRVGHGVGFTDDGNAPCLESLAEAARTFGYMERAGFGDDGRVYLIGGDA